MKIVVATDSFKGCMTSLEVGNCIKEEIQNHIKSDIKVFPLADGGEGTVEALMSCMNGYEVPVTVTGPLGEKIDSYYGEVPEQKLAVMEMANVAGITLVPEVSKNPMNTTTYGVGEMILAAAEHGCRKFLIGIGGSATNDGGLGMLSALGVKFFDANGKRAGIFGRDMLRVQKVDTSEMAPILKECHFTIMCDVTNPLCGELGSSAIYGPQKGANEKIIKQMDEGLANYARVINRDTGRDCAEMKGAGAAGGLGFAFLSFLDTEFGEGISYILDKLGLEEEIKDAQLVITGEGCLDAQTVMGKAPIGVADMAKKHGVAVIALAGTTKADTVKCNQAGIDAYFDICPGPMTVQDAMDLETTKCNITSTVKQICNLIKVVNKTDWR